ncbi:hypothetical protein ACIRQF_30575 [Streptomyces sp. NPDC101191]|uniref:hypothetical protein n=1 Tax=Streptomyces sp. NPDC101191 TaxID=3366126 RepID=UPI0037F5E281
MEEFSPDGAFQLVELQRERAGHESEIGCAGFECGEEYADLEPAQAEPAVKCFFCCCPDIEWHGCFDFGDQFVPAPAGRPTGNSEMVQSATD